MADIEALLAQADLQLRRVALEMYKAEVTKGDPVVKAVNGLASTVGILIQVIRQQ